jgi:hypothetical protein
MQSAILAGIMLRSLVFISLLAVLTGCASTAARPAKSSYGCMEAAIANKLPADLPDKHAHCLASGLIARYCSQSEAYLAGFGKELRDLFGSGDAEWRDWRADRVGIACAREAGNDADIASCCSERGY